METAEAGPVIRALGRIDDDLAEQANAHAEKTGYVRSMKQYITTLEAALFDQFDKTLSATERREMAKSALHENEEYQKYLAAVRELGKLDTMFQYLDTRRSIGQSILKQLQREADEKYGQGAGQHGTQPRN